MSVNDPRAQLTKGEELLCSGDLQGALTTFLQILTSEPENAAAINNAAVTLWQSGSAGEAAELFERALRIDPPNEQAFYNLIDLLTEAEAIELVEEVFGTYGNRIPETAEKERYAATIAAITGSKSIDTVASLNSELASASTNENARVHSASAGTDGLKIAFVCGPNNNFITEVEDRIARSHTVRRVHFQSNVDLNQIQEAMDWADVAWFEWCDQVLVHASKRLRKTCAVVCRIHSYEVFTELPAQVEWAFVDELIFVAGHIRSIFASTFEVEKPTTIIPNGVDVAKLKFKDRSKSHNIAYVGYLNYKKNPEMLLQCMSELVRRNPRYRLHIAGKFQDLRYALYFEKMIPTLGLTDNVLYDGWVDDIDAWLEDKSYLVSTSVLESFGMGIAEAMAKGLKPLIHNWVGAEDIYPKEYLFNTVRDFADRVQEREYNSKEYRQFIEQNYALDDQTDKLDVLLRQIAGRSTARMLGHGAGVGTAIVPKNVYESFATKEQEG